MCISFSGLTLVLVVRLAGIEQCMIDDITGEHAEGLVREHVLDCLVHALLQGNGRITHVVAIGTGWV